ncbi:MAG: hypothetical protein KGN34_19030 [Sphingomonadales bacterium]|nr:hypothetical protein [Sphingomonadales bacterium]
MNPDPDDIRAWQRLDSATTTSGVLTPDDFARLAKIGVRHIINLALPDSPGILPDEPARCAAAGIAYTNIPIPFGAPTDAHFAAFRAALAAVPGPVHVHCVMNWRVSACFHRLHRERGMATADAHALMNRQWNPATSDHPDAPAWAAFIAR